MHEPKPKPWRIPDGHHATGTTVARLFDVTPGAVTRWDCPRVDVGKKAPAYDLVAVVEWKFNKIVKEAESLMPGDAKDEWSTRYRRAKALDVELTLAERQNELIPTDHVRQILTRMGAILRRGAESIQRAYGDAAMVIYENMLDEWLREVDKVIEGELKESETEK